MQGESDDKRQVEQSERFAFGIENALGKAGENWGCEENCLPIYLGWDNIKCIQKVLLCQQV